MRKRIWKKQVYCLDYSLNVVFTSLINRTRPSQHLPPEQIRPQAKSYAEVRNEVCYKVYINAWSCSVAQDWCSEFTWMPFNPFILFYSAEVQSDKKKNPARILKILQYVIEIFQTRIRVYCTIWWLNVSGMEGCLGMIERHCTAINTVTNPLQHHTPPC